MNSLRDLSDSALVAHLYEMREEERARVVVFLQHLNELDRRGTVLELGYSSLFVFCTDYLGMPPSTTFRRTTCARLLGRFPVLADYLADGRLNTRTLTALRGVLEEDRLAEILDRAAGRTEEQVKALVAALQPQPALPDLFRRLPVPALAKAEPVVEACRDEDRVAPALEAQTPAAATRPAGRVEPIAERLHVLRVTVGDEFKADLEAVRAELSHKLPGAGLEEILHECIRVTLETVRRRRRGAGKRTSAEAPPKGSPYVPAAIRSEVWRRDGGECTFVGTDGHRCASRYRVQVHHLDPRGKDGPTTVENLTLRCQAHNLHAARQDYGAEHVARAIARSRSRARERSQVPAGTWPVAQQEGLGRFAKRTG